MMVHVPTDKLWRSVSHRLSDWIAACILSSVGGLLFWDISLLERGAYGGMEVVAYQPTWATAFLLIGVLRFTVLMFDALDPPRPLLRAAGASSSGFLWLQISLTYLGTIENWGILIAVCPWLFVMDFVAMLRAAAEVEASSPGDLNG